MGQLRRLQPLAEYALDSYGLRKAHPQFFRHAGNILSRVYDPDPGSSPVDDDLFVLGQYLLRIYRPGWQTLEGIELEMAWLAAMRYKAGLPVPEPVPGRDGSFLSIVSTSGIPEARGCTLLRWIKGRHVHGNGHPKHYRAQGQLLARIHNFTQQWQPPLKHTKRQYDWEGLFMNDAEIGLPTGESWNFLPKPWAVAFEAVACKTRQLMDAWGKLPVVYGLIHADVGLDSNVLFRGPEPRLIDFDSSGFGYWIYDLAVALEHCRDDPEYPRFRDALLGGYIEYRPLPGEQLVQFDLFQAAFSVYWDLWAIGYTHLHPEYFSEFKQRIDREAALVLQYVASQG